MTQATSFVLKMPDELLHQFVNDIFGIEEYVIFRICVYIWYVEAASLL